MPEVSLILLKEKIIKTDIVIHLLAEKNEKITQLREKLKMLYHKYVDKVKECEVLQLKCDLCKIEHDPLIINLKELTIKYEALEKDHQKEMSISQLRYQNKYVELESEIERYKGLLHQQEQCKTCEDANVKYETLSKKYEKVTKQFHTLTNKYQEDQENLRNLQKDFSDMENNHLDQINLMKVKHMNEITELQNTISSIKSTKTNLEQLNHELPSFNNFNINDEDSCIENIEKPNLFNDKDLVMCDLGSEEELKHMLNMLPCDEIPLLLSPLSDTTTDSQSNGNGCIEELVYGANAVDDATANIVLEIHDISNASCDSDIDSHKSCLEELSSGVEQCPDTLLPELVEDDENMLDNIDVERLNEDNATTQLKTAVENIAQKDENYNSSINVCDNLETDTEPHTDYSTNQKNLNIEENQDKFVILSAQCNVYVEKILNYQYKRIYIPRSTADEDLLGFLMECPELQQVENEISTYIRGLQQGIIKNKENNSIADTSPYGPSVSQCILTSNTESSPFDNNSRNNLNYINEITESEPVGNVTSQNQLSISLINNRKLECDSHNPLNTDVQGENASESVYNTKTTHSFKLKCSTEVTSEYKKVCDEYVEALHEILGYRQQSIQYISHPLVKNNFLGFKHKLRKKTALQVTRMRNDRRRFPFKKMKSELFRALVKHFTKKIGLNRMFNIYGKERTKYHSPSFRNMRRLQMLRWKRLRELWLSSTDTDSDYSRRLQHVKIRNRSKKPPEKQLVEETNKEDVHTKEKSDISEDELLLKEVMKTEQHYQNLLAKHKEFEEFYYTSIDELTGESSSNNTLQQSDTQLCIDKDDLISGDSGYVKSDLDEVNVSVTCKRKRNNAGEGTGKKKIMLAKGDNDDCKTDLGMVKVGNTEVNTEVVSSCVTNVNDIVNNTSKGIYCGDFDVSDVKRNVTAEICALLNRIEAEDADELEHNSLNNNCDMVNLFGSSCESLSSEVETNTLPFAERRISPRKNNGKNNASAKQKSTTNRTRKRVGQREDSTKSVLNNRIGNSVEVRLETYTKDNPVINDCDKNTESMLISKLNSNQNRRKSKSIGCLTSNSSRLEQIPQTTVEDNVEDPLRTRLWQECVSSLTEISIKNDAIRTSYKRSNSLKNPQKILEESLSSVKTCNEIPLTTEKIKTKVLREDKAKALLKQLLTFPDKVTILDEVAAAFSTQDHVFIARIILLETSLDSSKADTKFTPPAPVLTETQRILLGFLVRLDRILPGFLENFIMEAEKYLLTSSTLQCVQSITRLYLSVCKLQRKIHRMRRMVCDALYFMGDLSIPFLFTVLSTWIEVLPVESEINDRLIVKVILEVVKLKNCISPGYNLTPLKSLLKSYYGYDMEQSCLDTIFYQVFIKYTESQTKILEYALLLLCKNVPKTWIKQQIEQYMNPIVDNTTDPLLKANILRIVKSITEEHNPPVDETFSNKLSKNVL